jgi:hypothetical protein
MNGIPLFQIAYFAHIGATIIGAAAIPWLTRRWPNAPWITALLAAGCAALAVSAFLVSDPPQIFQDFRIAYYPAGKAILMDPTQLRVLTGMGVSGFVNMPVVAYLFAPLALLPMSTATILFMVSALAATAVAWWLLARLTGLDRTRRWLLALLFAANGPLQYSVKEGNSSHFILLALAGSLALLRSARPATAGALLGAAAIVKPPLLIFGIFFILRRDIRGLAGFAATCAAAVALSLAIFGWDDNLQWFEQCVLQFSRCWLAAFNVQSIPAFLFRFQAAPALLRDWNAYMPPTSLMLPAQLLLGLLFAAGAAAALRAPAMQAEQDTEERRDLQYGLVLCLAVLSSPLSWSHYYCWLLLPAALFLGMRSVTLPIRVCGWLAILLVTPLVRPLVFSQAWAVEFYKDIAVSHFLFGGLLWFGLLAWRLARPGTRSALPTTGYSLPSSASPS